MELALFRHDLLQTGASAKGTLAVLPVAEDGKAHKVATGDLNGVLQCVGVKKGELLTSFKNLPAPNAKITSLTLGKGAQQQDRIFVAAGSSIKGVSKKGKEFFKFNTHVTETIKKVEVHDLMIWSSAEYVHNQYVEGKDHALYLAPDRINDAVILPLTNQSEWNVILGCQDRQLRLLMGEQLIYEVATSSAPTCLLHTPQAHAFNHKVNPAAKQLLYGTEAGTLSQLLLEPDQARPGFHLPNPKKLGAINAIYSGLDLSRSGYNDIVIGREDGSLEVYDLDDTGALQQIFTAQLNESINTVDGGCISNPTVPELVLHTFSGKVVTYSPAGGGLLLPEGDKRLKGAVTEADQRRVAYDAQLSALKAELADLQGHLDKEKKGFQGNTAVLAAAAPFTLRDRCRLDAEEACYTLALETSAPIFTVAIQASLPLTLMDVPSNVAIISRSKPDPANGNVTLATYRCQDATCRLSIKFKMKEGLSGSVQAFIIPSAVPKTCMAVTHKIKPLCLHERITEPDLTRPTNELLVTGNFDMSMMLGWLTNLLPELPPQVTTSDSISLSYQNSLLGTQLIIRYQACEARFMSELITTLSIVHDHIMKEATASSTRVSVNFSPNTAALQNSVTAVWAKLAAQRTLKSQIELLDGLLELKMQEPEIGSCLTPQQQKILNDEQELREQYKTQPQHLDHLTSLIKDIYQDFCKLAGLGVPRARLPVLEQLLSDPHSTLDQMLEFMLNKSL